MVVNIVNPTSDMSQPLLYNEGKVEREAGRVLAVSGMPGDSPEDIRRTFERYEHLNRRSRNVSFHMSIDPLEGQDRMTDEDIVRFAGKLMEGLGYGRQPYVVYRHDDIDRVHYHVISVRVDGNGKKISDYQEKWKCYRLCRELEKEFDFLVGNVSKKRSRVEMDRFDRSKGNVTGQMGSLYEDCLKYRFTSFAQFQAIARAHGLQLEERTASAPKLTLQGLDAEGRTCTGKLSSIALGMDLYSLYSGRAMETLAGMDGLSAERNRIRVLVQEPLRDSSSQAHFRSILFRKGIDFRIVRDPKTGRITDANIIDHVTKSAFRLSDMGPDLTLDMLREADTERWEHGGRDSGPELTLGDFLAGLGGRPSRSHEKDIRDNPRKKKTKLKF